MLGCNDAAQEATPELRRKDKEVEAAMAELQKNLGRFKGTVGSSARRVSGWVWVMLCLREPVVELPLLHD